MRGGCGRAMVRVQAGLESNLLALSTFPAQACKVLAVAVLPTIPFVSPFLSPFVLSSCRPFARSAANTGK
jgi:hypothetical protein